MHHEWSVLFDCQCIINMLILSFQLSVKSSTHHVAIALRRFLSDGKSDILGLVYKNWGSKWQSIYVNFCWCKVCAKNKNGIIQNEATQNLPRWLSLRHNILNQFFGFFDAPRSVFRIWRQQLRLRRWTLPEHHGQSIWKFSLLNTLFVLYKHF